MTPEALKRAEARAEARRKRGPADSWEDLSLNLSTRCIQGFNSGPPMIPANYNNNYQIFQTRDYVAIVAKMIHNTRIIPLDGRPHLPHTSARGSAIRVATGRRNALVVETTNLTDKTLFRGANENMRLIERFTRVDAGTLKYEFTVNDPTMFTRPWSAEIPMLKTKDRIYACHEGNYALEGHPQWRSRRREKGSGSREQKEI